MNRQAQHTDQASDPAVVGFTEMQHGTAEDYALLDRYEETYKQGLADRLLDTLDRLRGSLGGYQITRLEHSLQAATRARRAGADLDWVVAALLHDIGDELAPYNHSELAASILQPYVREEVHWVVQHHGVFQSYYYAHHFEQDRNERDRFADSPWFELCKQFCAEWDQNSFDPDYPTDDLASFESDVHELLSRRQWSPEVIKAGPAQLYP